MSQRSLKPAGPLNLRLSARTIQRVTVCVGGGAACASSPTQHRLRGRRGNPWKFRKMASRRKERVSQFGKNQSCRPSSILAGKARYVFNILLFGCSETKHLTLFSIPEPIFLRIAYCCRSSSSTSVCLCCNGQKCCQAAGAHG